VSTSSVSAVGNTPTPDQVSRSDKKGLLGQDAFMQLLVAQMQHQDPLAPTDSGQMMAQLAQFTSVEQLNNVATSMQSLHTGQTFQASVALIGKTVSYKAADGSLTSDVVTGVKNTAANGAVLLLGTDGSKQLDLSAVTRVQ
jgi:flagellar basal-body rod modification protein FlgD